MLCKHNLSAKHTDMNMNTLMFPAEDLGSLCTCACSYMARYTSRFCSADPSVIAKHQPMIWGSDRIQSGYNAIIARPSYAKPSYLLTFNGEHIHFPLYSQQASHTGAVARRTSTVAKGMSTSSVNSDSCHTRTYIVHTTLTHS